MHWHTLSIQETLDELNASPEGLSYDEVKHRLKRYGHNILHLKNNETALHILLRQLKNPIVYVLLISTCLALALGKWTDGIVVFGIVILNTCIGFFQEYRANRMISLLSEMVPQETTVMRDGKLKVISSGLVVPGDIVSLQAGDRICADLRLLAIKNLHCDESMLTGESLPAAKHTHSVAVEAFISDRKCLAFGGTYVTAGTASGVVTGTALQTEFGKIAALTKNTSSLETPLSLTLHNIASLLTWGVLVIGLSLFLVGYVRGTHVFDSILAAVTLAVAAIPEGLPAVITITSAIGVKRMAQRKAIVRQLPAVEALGSTSVICTDKTGTLTHNEMTAQQIWTPSGTSFVTGSGFALEGHFLFPEKNTEATQKEVHRLLQVAMLCSDASLVFDAATGTWNPVGDPTELALIIAGRKLQLNETELRQQQHIDDVLPFESERRMMAVLHSRRELLIKGAPETVLSACGLDTTYLCHVDSMAREGMRVLAIASKTLSTPQSMIEESDVLHAFSLLGFIGLVDPPKPEVYAALKACKEAGITVKMVTGDHPTTAQTIGRELGISDEKHTALTGADLDALSDEEWVEVAQSHHIFARVAPEHKLKLVEALQKTGAVVAMTGDGVNDAPALKRADIGIAMGIKGTAVAKEAADMILVDDHFASIEAAVEEGRRVYDNLIKSLTFLLPTNIGQALIMFLAVLFFPVKEGVLLPPLLPVQILWINLVVAVALALPLALELPEPDIMRRPPRNKRAPILTMALCFQTLVVSLLMALGTIALFLWHYHTKHDLSQAQTIAVTTLMLFQIFFLFHCRSSTRSIFKTPFFSNPSLLFGVAIVLLAQLAFTYVPFMNTLFHSSPLNLQAWVISLVAACALFSLITLKKIPSQPVI